MVSYITWQATFFTKHSKTYSILRHKEENPYFKLAHSEDDFVVAQLKAQGAITGDFAYYSGLRGPIRIWEINYPAGMQVIPEYVQTNYVNPNVSIARWYHIFWLYQ